MVLSLTSSRPSGSQQAAIAAYEDWNKAVTPEVRDAYADLIRAWTNWEPWILGYFDHPVTNAYTESLNSVIRVRTPGKKAAPHETAEPAKNYGADINTLTELIESGKL
jgi:hypothetical protein